MDGLNLYVTVSAIVLGVGSAVLNLAGRQKYKDNASFFEAANHELREQNGAYRDEIADLKTQLVQAKTESTQKDETIKQLKPFSDLARTVSNNHKEVLTTMTDKFSEIMKLLGGKIDGRQREN